MESRKNREEKSKKFINFETPLYWRVIGFGHYMIEFVNLRDCGEER